MHRAVTSVSSIIVLLYYCTPFKVAQGVGFNESPENYVRLRICKLILLW